MHQCSAFPLLTPNFSLCPLACDSRMSGSVLLLLILSSSCILPLTQCFLLCFLLTTFLSPHCSHSTETHPDQSMFLNPLFPTPTSPFLIAFTFCPKEIICPTFCRLPSTRLDAGLATWEPTEWAQENCIEERIDDVQEFGLNFFS